MVSKSLGFFLPSYKCTGIIKKLIFFKFDILVSSLSDHDIPLTQPSTISLEARFVNMNYNFTAKFYVFWRLVLLNKLVFIYSSVDLSEVVSPAVVNREPARGAVRQQVTGVTPAPHSTPAPARSETFTPNVSTGFVVTIAMASADVPSTSTGKVFLGEIILSIMMSNIQYSYSEEIF